MDDRIRRGGLQSCGAKPSYVLSRVALRIASRLLRMRRSTPNHVASFAITTPSFSAANGFHSTKSNSQSITLTEEKRSEQLDSPHGTIISAFASTFWCICLTAEHRDSRIATRAPPNYFSETYESHSLRHPPKRCTHKRPSSSIGGVDQAHAQQSSPGIEYLGIYSP